MADTTETTPEVENKDVALYFTGGKKHSVDGIQTSNVTLAQAKAYEAGGWDITSILRTESFEPGPACLEKWLNPPTEKSEEPVKE